MRYLNKYKLGCLVCAIVLLFLAGCNGLDETETVADKFLRAAVENDLATLQEVVDPDYQEDVISAIYLQMGLSAFVGGAAGEYTELTVETTSNDGTYATVHYEGKLKAQVLGTQMISPVEGDIPLVHKNGHWYVTGETP